MNAIQRGDHQRHHDGHINGSHKYEKHHASTHHQKHHGSHGTSQTQNWLASTTGSQYDSQRQQHQAQRQGNNVYNSNRQFTAAHNQQPQQQPHRRQSYEHSYSPHSTQRRHSVNSNAATTPRGDYYQHNGTPSANGHRQPNGVTPNHSPRHEGHSAKHDVRQTSGSHMNGHDVHTLASPPAARKQSDGQPTSYHHSPVKTSVAPHSSSDAHGVNHVPSLYTSMSLPVATPASKSERQLSAPASRQRDGQHHRTNDQHSPHTSHPHSCSSITQHEHHRLPLNINLAQMACAEWQSRSAC